MPGCKRSGGPSHYSDGKLQSSSERGRINLEKYPTLFIAVAVVNEIIVEGPMPSVLERYYTCTHYRQFPSVC